MKIEQYALISHRGIFNNKAGIPENSMAAFKRSLERGHGIELDVRITRDDQIVVIHDNDLKRMTGAQGRVEDKTLAELSALRLLGTEHKIPAFKEVLALIDGKVPLIIEIKNENKANLGRLERALLALLQDYKGELVLESFNPYVVRWLKLNAAQYVRGQLICHKENVKHARIKNKLIDKMMINPLTKPDFIAYEISVLNDKIAKRIKKANIPIVAWTVKTPQQLALAQRLCDSIIYEGLEL